MPYEGEFASYGPLRRVATSERIREVLGSWRRSPVSEGSTPETRPPASRIRPSQFVPDWILAVDGSHHEVAIENGFPGAEAAYVTVASVMLDVAKMTALDAYRPVNPKEFRSTQHAESIDSALPGCNVVLESEETAQASLRKTVFDVFSSVRMSEDCESLRDTYEHLLAGRAGGDRQECPFEDCPDRATFVPSPGESSCSCEKDRTWYSTDALRFHEGMNHAGTNGAMYAEVMQVWERVWIVHILRTLEQKGWLSSLGRLAIVLDGPLAVFGHPAWLSQSIVTELYRLNAAIREATGSDLLLVGVEKSGFFVDHFAALDTPSDGAEIPPETVFLLQDSYIKQNIIFSKSTKPYGVDTYFGRKFLYKTAARARVVATTPFLAPEHRDLSTARPDQYPRLADALSLLNRLVSSRFPNAITPLIIAHSEAAIPLNLGKKVLEQLARDFVRDE